VVGILANAAAIWSATELEPELIGWQRGRIDTGTWLPGSFPNGWK
jgi:hypothetical protein